MQAKRGENPPPFAPERQARLACARRVPVDAEGVPPGRGKHEDQRAPVRQDTGDRLGGPRARRRGRFYRGFGPSFGGVGCKLARRPLGVGFGNEQRDLVLQPRQFAAHARGHQDERVLARALGVGEAADDDRFVVARGCLATLGRHRAVAVVVENWGYRGEW